MPYNFGDWTGVGEAIGDKIAGRPSARQKKDDATALAAKMAQDKLDYEKEQDKIKNFADYGGYDPKQVMEGSEQAALLSDEDMAGFQRSMADPNNPATPERYKDASKFNPAAERAFKGFQLKLGERGLTFEQRKALQESDRAAKLELKKTPSGGTVDKYAGLGASKEDPLEDTTDYNGPFDWRHPFKTFGKGEKPAGKDTLKLF